MSVFSQPLKKYLAATDLLPDYHTHVDERIVAMGDDKLLGIVELQGIPFETTPDAQLIHRFNSVTRVLSEIGKVNAPRIAQWNHIIKRRVSLKFDYEFDNPFVAAFSKKYCEQFQTGRFYRTTYGMCFVYKYDDEGLSDGIEKLNMLLDFVSRAFDSYDSVVLGLESNEHGVVGSQIGRYLKRLVDYDDGFVPLGSQALREVITDSELHFGYDMAELRPAFGGRKFASFFDLSSYPDMAKRGMWNTLLGAPIEFVLTQSFLHFTPSETLTSVNRKINAISSGSNFPEHYVDELAAAKGYVAAGEISFGEYHSALLVYGDSPKEAVDNGNSLATSLLASSAARFVRATSSGIYTYYSMMPGSAFKPYAEPKTTRNVACGFSLNNYPVGKQYGNPIGDGSAIMPLKTRSDGLYFLNTHFSAVGANVTGQKFPGHLLMLGATGSGKTTLEGTIVGMLTRFNPKIFAIDYNRSMQLFLEAYGAVYFDIEDNVDTGLQPFQLNDSPALRSFLYQLVAACGADSNGQVTASEEKRIKDAVDTVLQMDLRDRRFSYVSELIPPSDSEPNGLGARLAKWSHSRGGHLAWALDSPSNRFNPADMHRIGFNTTSLLKPGNPATEPVLAVLFFMKEMMQRDGDLLLSLVEEFWVPANYPITQKQIAGSLKAGRIKGEFMFLVSQSPEDAINCAIFAAIVQQTPTKIFLPNPDAKFESYEKCSLNEKEFAELQALEKDSRTFLIKQSHQSTFAKLDLSGFDDFLPIISCTWEGIALAKEVRKAVGNDPKQWVPEFQARMRAERQKKSLTDKRE